VRLSKPESNGALKSLEGVADAREVDGAYVLHSMRPPQAIVSLVKHLESEGNELVSLEIATPSLEDVFIEMTEGGYAIEKLSRTQRACAFAWLCGIRCFSSFSSLCLSLFSSCGLE